MDFFRTQLGFRKSQEYKEVKSNINNLTFELKGLGSKRLNQGEIVRFRNRYKRFADKVNKKDFSRNEYMKLRKLLVEFERCFQNTGIIPIQMANEKCCKKHGTNEENKFSTTYYGSWESGESEEQSTSSQKNEVSSQLHYENETDQMRKKQQQYIKRNDLAQVHSSQHNGDENQSTASSRNADRTSPAKQSGTGSVYYRDRLTPMSEQQNTKSTQSIENIRNLPRQSSSKPSIFPEGRNTRAITQNTKTEQHIRDLPQHKSSEILLNSLSDSRSTQTTPSYISEERNTRTVTPTKMNENVRYLSQPEFSGNGPSEGFIHVSSPYNASYVPGERSTRAVTPTQSTRTGTEENIRDLSQQKFSETIPNFLYSANLTQRQQDFFQTLSSPKPSYISDENNKHSATPTQYTKIKENIGNISSYRDFFENYDYSRLNEGFIQSTPPNHASCVSVENNTRAVTPTQIPYNSHERSEATIRNTNNFQNSPFSSDSRERNTRDPYLEATYGRKENFQYSQTNAKGESKEESTSRKSEKPYNTQDRNSEEKDKLEVGPTEFSQFTNIDEKTTEIQEKIKSLDEFLKIYEESETSPENKTNYKNLQKQAIQKGKVVEENMTDDKQNTYFTPTSEAYPKKYHILDNFDNLARSSGRGAETPNPQILHQYDQHPRRSTGNEFCSTFHEKQAKLGGYSPQNSHGLKPSANRLHENKYIETNLDDVRPLPRGSYREKIISNIPQQYDERHAYRGGHQRSRMRRERESTDLRELKTEIAQEAVEQPSLQILDVHQYFRDDFDINSIDDSLDHESKIKILESVAKRYDNQVSNFSEEKFSLEYFVLDEKLMRLIEKLDKIKCHDDHEATNRKVQVIEYIKGLHTKLDERAKED